MSSFAVIIAAAGSGTRFDSGNQKKTYAMLGGKPVWQHCVEKFAARDDVVQIVVVVSAEDLAWFSQTYGDLLAAFRAEVVAGGAQRSDSVENGLSNVADEVEFVAIHDAARPCIDDGLIERVFSAARQFGNVTPAVPVSSTLKRSSDSHKIDETVDRSELFMAQTPQVFRVGEIRQAFIDRDETQPTDESQLFESQGRDVFLAEGCPLNIKITTQADLRFAAAVIASFDRRDAQPIRFDAPAGDVELR